MSESFPPLDSITCENVGEWRRRESNPRNVPAALTDASESNRWNLSALGLHVTGAER